MFEFVEYEIEEREEKMGITLNEMKIDSKKLFLSIKEVEEAIEKVGNGYASLYVSGDIDKKDLIDELNIQYYSDIDGFFIGRVKNIFIFIGDNKVNEYLNKYIVKAIECKLNLDIDTLKRWIKDYKEILEEIDKEIEDIKKGEIPKKESIGKLIERNRTLMPFITENEERIKRIKNLSEREGLNGVFNSILMEIPEEEIATLRVWIDVSLQYENLLMQYHTERRETILQSSVILITVILGLGAFLSIFFDNWPTFYNYLKNIIPAYLAKYTATLLFGIFLSILLVISYFLYKLPLWITKLKNR